MKRCLLIIFFFLILISPVYGQEKTGTEYYQEYLNYHRNYQNLVEPFNQTKGKFINFQSVVSRAEYLEISQKLLSAEVEAILSYTVYLKTKLAEATKVLQYGENLIYIKLDDEIASLTESKDGIYDLSSIEEVRLFAGELAKHYKTISVYAYQIKSTTEIVSLERNYTNLRIEREKLAEILLPQADDLPTIKATREKTQILEKQLSLAGESVEKIKISVKEIKGEESRYLSESVFKKVQQVNLDLENILSELINISGTISQ